MATAESISRSYWKAEMARELEEVMSYYRDDAVFEAPGVRLEGQDIRRFYEESFKAFSKFGAPRESFRENFDGNVTAEARVARAKHFAHAARAERRQNFVRAEF